MSFKKMNTGCCDCGGCEIGFYGQVIDAVVNAFPDAHGNANVNDPDTINSAVWGVNNNKRLDIFYFGYPFDHTSCQPMSDPDFSNDFIVELAANFMGDRGGKILVVAENSAPVPEVSVGCLEDADIDIYNDFLSDMLSSSLRFQKDTNLDLGCQANTNVITSHFDPFFQAIISHMNNGVTQINMGGSSAVTQISGCDLLMSVEDDEQAIIAIEKLGAGYILCICDSNMFDSCIEGGSFEWGEEQANGNFRKFLGNFCTLPNIAPDGGT